MKNAQAATAESYRGNHCSSGTDQLPVSHKLAYAAGGLTDFFYLNILLGLATQIYVTGMGLNMALLGFALAIPKVVGAITDPLAGAWSDNTRGRWGRRRPYIIVGGIAGGILLPLMWCVPAGTSSITGINHAAGWISQLTGMPLTSADLIRFSYLAAIISIFSVFYSIFSIPYNALGYELTNNYDERTRLFAWKGYLLAFAALSGAWFYKFCTLSIFPNEVIGVRWLSIIASAIMIGGTLIVALVCREQTRQQKQAPLPIGEALRLTLANRPFLLLQAATQILGLALAITGPMGWLVFLHYVCQSSKSLAADISAYGGTIAFFTQLASNGLGVWISTRFGKREGGMVGFVLILLSISILPWTLTSEHPWWNVAAWIIAGMGSPLITLMIGSMTADVCDEDELRTGLRREGAYSAVNGFIGKLMQILIVLIGGFLPWLAGYRDSSLPPTEMLLIRMKYLLIGLQAGGVFLALLAFWFYPITRARAEQTRQELDNRKNNQYCPSFPRARPDK